MDPLKIFAHRKCPLAQSACTYCRKPAGAGLLRPAKGPQMRRMGLMVLASLILAGCLGPRKDPTRYYTLGQLTPSDFQPPTRLPLPCVALRVSVEPYLKNPRLLWRKGETEIVYNEFQRWAEPLEHGVAQVLATEMQKKLSVTQVGVQGGPEGAAPQFFLHVHFLQLEPNDHQRAVLLARCTLERAPSLAPVWAQEYALEDSVSSGPVEDRPLGRSSARRDYLPAAAVQSMRGLLNQLAFSLSAVLEKQAD